jgi:hypothetical protein
MLRRAAWVVRFLVLLALVLVSAEWALSYRRTCEFDAAYVRASTPDGAGNAADEALAVTLVSRRGRIDVAAMAIDPRTSNVLPGFSCVVPLNLWWLYETYAEPPGAPTAAAFDFAAVGGAAGGPAKKGWRVRAPDWALLVPTAAVLVASVVPAWRRRSRRRRGLCLRCGYDLRFSSDRCPECGLEKSGSAPPPMS